MKIHWMRQRKRLVSLLAILMLIGLVTALAPVERTLGERARLVYFHGAWVWAGKIAFAAAAATGLIGLLSPAAQATRRTWQHVSQSPGVDRHDILAYLSAALLAGTEDELGRHFLG